jgi:hypothetical protein
VRLTPDLAIADTPGIDDGFHEVGADAAGQVVVAWNQQPCTNGPCRPTLRARRLDALGQPLGGEIEVNVSPASPGRDSPALAVRPEGSFLVAWGGEFSNGQGGRLLARCYDGDGNPFGGEVVVSEAVVAPGNPKVAALAGGGYVLVWRTSPPNGPNGIVSRRLDSACTPLGPEGEVHPPDFNTTEPAVAAASGGGFLVIWHQFSPRRSEGIAGQLFGADGQSVGDPIAILPQAPRSVDNPFVAANPRGGFAVAWRSRSSGNISLRRLDAGGMPAGPVIVVDPRSSSVLLGLAFDSEGGLIVSWQTLDGNELGCCVGRWFEPSGQPAGPVFSVASGSGLTGNPKVAATGSREFFVAWQNNPQTPGSHLRILGRKIRIPTLGADPCLVGQGVLTCDTLRDGDTAELSVSIPEGTLPLLGDPDGSGQDDACTFTDGTFSCNLGHGGTSPATFRFGSAVDDLPLLGDVNGDGRDDACLRRRRRFVCDTAHNGGIGEVQIFFGNPGATPLLGDVDGDGDDEPCVWDGGTFLCDTAHDGGAAEAGASFGEPGDFPLLGDVDGDGDDDFCVFRTDRFLCDTAHDGGAPEVEILFGEPGAIPLLGNVDGF